MSERSGESYEKTWPTQASLTAREAADILNLNERTIRRAIQRGELVATKWGGVYRIDRGDLTRFRDARRTAVSHVDAPSDFEPAWQESAPFCVPASLTPLIGREREVTLLQDLLLAADGPRLLVLTGPGGVGKTRLAMALATTAGDDFADGVAFIPLASIRDPTMALATIAEACGVREAGEQRLMDRMTTELAGKRLLLIIDNFEQVVAAGPSLGSLLAACPFLTIVVTSRARLRLTGEHVFPVQPLDIDMATGGDEPDLPSFSLPPAVQLFVARSQAIYPAFRLSDENANVVREICRRLDGLPLAIELAAAQSAALPPAELLARLDQCLPMLNEGPRDLPLRQQTMRNAIAWSYDLLTPEEQTLLRRLSVFAGGFTLAAADAVAGEQGATTAQGVLNGIVSLVDKSLLRRTSDCDATARLAMLETVREFGWEQLQEQRELDAIRQRHTEYYLALAEKSERELRSHELVKALRRLEAEHDNLRAALTWSLEDPTRAETALRLTSALHWFWYLRDHYGEGRRWLEEALSGAAPTQPTPLRVTALAAAGLLAIHPGRDYAAARDWFEQSVALGRAAGDPGSLANALHFLAWAELLQRDPVQVRSSVEESIALFRQTGDQWGIATALCTLGMTLIVEGDVDAARAELTESLALARDIGDIWGIARSLHYAGEVARFVGNVEEARELYEESIALYRRLDHRGAVAIVLHNLGCVAQCQGRPRHAMAYFAEALAEHVRLRDQQNIGHCLVGIAGAAVRKGNVKQAARLFGAADAHFEHLGTTIWPVDRAHDERNRENARRLLSKPEFAFAHDSGRKLPLAQAILEAEVIALAENPAASLECDVPDPSDAKRPFGLTPRELDVLRLVAEHATNRQIADRLSISPRTVMHHVSNLLAKLGVSHRRAAAASAARYGLV